MCGMVVSNTEVLVAVLVVLAVGLAWFAGKAAWAKIKRFDDEVEKRRAAAVELVGVCKTIGLDRAEKLAKMYAIGDYDGLAHELKSLGRDLLNPQAAIEVLNGVFYKQLPLRLRREEDRAMILKAVAEAEASAAKV